MLHEHLSITTPAHTSSITVEDSLKQKLSGSKYDFVKVRVHIDKHYYVLSRFIVSRVLSSCRISYKDANKIALALKKQLVDENKLDVAQGDMEQILFKIMKQYEYEYSIQYFVMMTKFYHQRTPLMILIYGTGCVGMCYISYIFTIQGKSTVATQMGERMNIPNVLQTDIVLDLLTTLTKGSNFSSTINPEPIWLHKVDNDEQFLTGFQKECKHMRDGIYCLQ